MLMMLGIYLLYQCTLTVVAGTVDGACLVPGSTLLELQHKKSPVLKTEVVGGVEAKKEEQKEMETCFGFDVSVCVHLLFSNLFVFSYIFFYLI